MAMWGAEQAEGERRRREALVKLESMLADLAVFEREEGRRLDARRAEIEKERQRIEEDYELDLQVRDAGR